MPPARRGPFAFPFALFLCWAEEVFVLVLDGGISGFAMTAVAEDLYTEVDEEVELGCLLIGAGARLLASCAATNAGLKHDADRKPLPSIRVTSLSLHHAGQLQQYGRRLSAYLW